MKTPRILALSIAAQLVTLITSHAQTWDGAGANGGDLDWTFANNWNPNGAPLNDGTANIIFGSVIDNNPGPNLDLNWSVNSVTFNNTAGAFILGSTGNLLLTVGAGGITNNDAQTMTFTHRVSLSGTQTINAAAGGLTFTDDLTLGGGLSGGNINGNFPVTITNGGSIGGISVDVGDGVDGTLVVSGATSSSFFGSGAVPNEFGLGGGTGTGTFSNGSLNNFLGDVDIGVGGAGSVGSVQVLSDAGLGISGDLRIGSDGTAGSVGTLTVNGVGSTAGLSVNTLTIGTAAGSTGTLNVQNSGLFDAGTGATVVGATGTIAITGGTFEANGNMTLIGQLTRDGSGVFTLAAGRTLSVQGGGDATITGSFTNSTASIIAVTGAGSTFSTTSTLTLNGGSTTNVLAGADATSGAGPIAIGSGTNGTVTVDGVGSTFNGGTLTLGFSGGTGSLTFSNGSSGAFTSMDVDNSGNSASSGTLSIQSGADVSGTSLTIAPNAVPNDGTVTVTGAGSTLTVTGAGTTDIGATSASTGVLNVESGGTFTSGTGTITIGTTGTVAITGGIFNANGNMIVNGQVTNDATGDFNLAAGRVLTVQNGGDVIFAGSLINDTASTITITGAGSTFATDLAISLRGGSNTNILAGGSLSGGSSFNVGVGSTTDGTVTVTGTGSTFSGGGDLDVAINGATGTVTFLNGSSGTFDGIDVADVAFGGTDGILSIESGADVTGTSLGIASAAFATTGSVTITGAGSTLTLSGNSQSFIGATSASTAALTVANGGAFTSNTGTFTVRTTGTVNIDGGTLTINGPLVSSGMWNFNSGALNLLGSNNLTIGIGGLLGTDLTLLSNRQLTVAGTTTIDFTRTLTIDGGTLRTGALQNNGTLDFQRGTLGITGAGGFNIGTGVLGANVVLGTGANLEVTNITTVSSGAALTTDGGSFLGGTLSNSGLVEHRSGVFTVTNTLQNQAGGDLFVERPLSVGSVFTNFPGAQLVLLNGTGRIQGAASFSNQGLVRGDGTLATAFTNTANGEVRGEFGKTLRFTGATGANAGQLNLLGGTLQFTQQSTNAAAGQINGQGALYFPTTPVPSILLPSAGLMNAGNINLTGGDSQIYGTVQMQAGSRLIVSGGATASFFDVFRHSGTEVRASAGSNIAFFGEVRGAGPFTGTGTVYFEGGYSPGNSPALVTHQGTVVLGTFNTLTMELGGTTRGTEYDALNVAGKLTFDGTMNVPLINGFQPQGGDVFDLFDFGTTAGAFTAVNLPPLIPGLLWSQANLYTAGEIAVALDPVFTGRIWDGGGANNDWATDFNWDLNVEPLNNGAAQLIFAGNVRLTPSVDTAWNVHSITFNNTAGAFTITGPQGITLGSDGVTNNDPQTQTIDAAIVLSADQTFTAAAGDLDIDNIALAGRTLALAGANDITLATASGTGVIDKNNAGRFDVTGALGTGGVTLNANAGATNLAASETLAALNIASGATVTLGAIPPPAPAPEFDDGGAFLEAPPQAVPEPGTISLLLAGLLAFGRSRFSRE